MSKKIVVSGYHGYNNTGDEAVLEAFIDFLRSRMPDVEVVVLSADPKLTAETYKVKSVGRFDLLAVFGELRRCDLLVSGGGSLLQDVTGTKSIPYYLGIIAMARMLKVKVSIFAQGIGPVSRSFFKRAIYRAFKRVDSISVRDRGSLQFLRSIGVDRTDVHVVSDPAFCLNPVEVPDRLAGKVDENTIVFAVRKWNGLIREETVASCIDRMCERIGTKAVLMAFQSDEDLKFAEGIAEMSRSAVEVVSCNLDPKIVEGIISHAGLVVGMRLHSLILAVSCSVPCAGISYDPKVDEFFKGLGLDEVVSLDDMAVEDDGGTEMLCDLVERSWYERKALHDRLEDRVLDMKNLAFKACEIAVSPIEGKKM